MQYHLNIISLEFKHINLSSAEIWNVYVIWSWVIVVAFCLFFFLRKEIIRLFKQLARVQVHNVYVYGLVLHNLIKMLF